MTPRRAVWLVAGASLLAAASAGSRLAAPRATGSAGRVPAPRPVRDGSLASRIPGSIALRADGMVLQRTRYDCGDAALATVLRHFGAARGYDDVSHDLKTPPSGATMLSLRDLARRRGLRSEGWRLAPADLDSVPLPAIVLLFGRHYAVVEARTGSGDFVVADPAQGRLVVPSRSLRAIWTGETLLFGTSEGAGPWLRRLPNLSP